MQRQQRQQVGKKCTGQQATVFPGRHRQPAAARACPPLVARQSLICSAPPCPAAAGANLVGMILWPRAKRSIPAALAREVAAAARAHGAEPVAVFVDEDAHTIARWAGGRAGGWVGWHGRCCKQACCRQVWVDAGRGCTWRLGKHLGHGVSKQYALQQAASHACRRSCRPAMQPARPAPPRPCPCSCRVCLESDVCIAQLHGDGARAALPHLPAHLAALYVMHADKAGRLQTAPPLQARWPIRGHRPQWPPHPPPQARARPGAPRRSVRGGAPPRDGLR